MRSIAIPLLAALLLAAAAAPVQGDPPRAPLAVCFAPGTPLDRRLRIESQVAKSGVALYQADDSARWSFTATDGSIFRRGEPTTLTWNVVPDGTFIAGEVGENGSNSDLRAYLDSIYGSESVWMPLFAQVFARWSEVSGVTYVRETADDSRSLGTASGSRGVRADIRIGGHPIDGNSDTLAYNFFPNDGDMVIDTSDRYFRTTSSNSLRLRNVVAHEHGHGLGLDHVCPIDETKLMEPISTTRLDGPQLDDILAAQRLYGDRLETADTAATATALGTLASGTTTVEDVSIDGTSDTDVYALTPAGGELLDVELIPVGRTYFEGPQNFNGNCGSGASFDSLRLSDLSLELLAPDGSSRVAFSDDAPAGGVERLLEVPIGGAGTRYVRVRGDRDDVQMYRLEITVTPATNIPAAADDAAETFEDVPVTVDVLANDSGLGGNHLTLRIVSSPSSGVAEVQGTKLRYVPTPNTSGTDSFVYEVDVDGRTAQATVTVVVRASAYAGAARLDADDDLYPDELEAALGSLTNDAGSRPALGDPLPATASKVKARLRYARAGRDELTVRGTLPLDSGTDLTGLTAVTYVGGVLRTFVLDAAGRATFGESRLRISPPDATGSTFTLRLRRALLVDSWSDEGFLPESGVRKEYRELTIFVVVAGRAFTVTPPLDFTVRRKAGKVTLR